MVPPPPTRSRFTLEQTIAWIAWKDQNRPLGPTKPPDFDRTEVESGSEDATDPAAITVLNLHNGTATKLMITAQDDAESIRARLRDAPNEPPEVSAWLNENARREADKRVAAVELEKAINAGELDSISGYLVTEGFPHWPWELIDCKVHHSVPPEVMAFPCKIPVTSLRAHGGWVHFIDEQKDGLPLGHRYCRATFDEDQVRQRWKATRPTNAIILKFMIELGTRFLAESNDVMKRGTFIYYAMERTHCTDRAAKAAYAKLPEHLRNPPRAGRPPRVTSTSR
jgi:hypothetical protein